MALVICVYSRQWTLFGSNLAISIRRSVGKRISNVEISVNVKRLI